MTEYTFKISIRYTSLDIWQIQSRLGSRACLFITPDANMTGYLTQNMSILVKVKKTNLHITIPIKGHEIESVKIEYLNEDAFLLCSGAYNQKILNCIFCIAAVHYFYVIK